MQPGPADWEWWWDAWKNRIRCRCGALIDKYLCPVCGADYRNPDPVEVIVDGKSFTVPQAFQGALDWSKYLMLQLMHQEWLRPAAQSALASIPEEKKPSTRILVVLLFWSYFESLMAWYYETATAGLPKPVADDLLKRYGFIGARIGRLHRLLFGATFGEDLESLGFKDIQLLLENVHTQRNAFVHGDPEAINDALVEDVARRFPAFQQAWIEAFNLRCAKPAS
jgi:hypothetical protein